MIYKIYIIYKKFDVFLIKFDMFLIEFIKYIIYKFNNY